MTAQRAPWVGLRQAMESVDLTPLADPLLAAAQRIHQTNRHGHWDAWRRIIAAVADLVSSSDDVLQHDFARAAVRIGGAPTGSPSDAGPSDDPQVQAQLKRLLLQLMPWRKGPFEFFGIRIDSEWRSNLKWARLCGKIGDLHGRRILDVGCGNGYYLWRMLGEGARLALGIDPSQLFIAQFYALKSPCGDCPAFALPLTSSQFPRKKIVGKNNLGDLSANSIGFDTVFSMGVLSHRRDPHAHLRELQQFTRRGGELVIETLVVNGGQDDILTPADRYAKMRNVYSIPSPLALENWLRQSGATDIRLLDLSQTTVAEQRTTEWMQFESLPDFLDPTDANKTIEGYPAPQRAVFVCRKPE